MDREVQRRVWLTVLRQKRDRNTKVSCHLVQSSCHCILWNLRLEVQRCPSTLVVSASQYTSSHFCILNSHSAGSLHTLEFEDPEADVKVWR